MNGCVLLDKYVYERVGGYVSDEKKLMKFDVVVGNPPYQEDNVKHSRSVPIYPLFYNLANKLSSIYCLVTPGRFLFGAGSTNDEWNKEMLFDKNVAVLHYDVNSRNMFSSADIKGGVVILYKNKYKTIGPIGIFTPYNELESILQKVCGSLCADVTVNDSIGSLLYGMTSYTLSSSVFDIYPDLIDRANVSSKLAMGSNVFSRYPELFVDKKDVNHICGIYGRDENQRVIKYINMDYVIKPDNFNGYKVFVPTSNGSGSLGEVLSTPLIGEPLIGHTGTFISFGNFDNRLDAENLLKYIKTKFARTMLGIKKATQHNNSRDVWSCVPLQDFTDTSDIDWMKDIAEIDQQLYKKYGLSEDEIEFIETKVKKMD